MSQTKVGHQEITRAKNIVVGVYENEKNSNLPLLIQQSISRIKKMGDFSGKEGEIEVIYTNIDYPARIFLCGLGTDKDIALDKIRRAVGRAVKRALKQKVTELLFISESFVCPKIKPQAVCQTIVLSSRLAEYQYTEFTSQKASDRPKPLGISLTGAASQEFRQVTNTSEAIAEAVNFSRTLSNRPANLLYPETLAKEAKRLAGRQAKITVRVKEKKELERLGLGALLAVGAGSQKPPVLIELHYQGGKPNAPAIALIGKGITFDSGGICLKPSAKMDEMRYDMSGAAAVLGIFKAAAKLKLPVNLLGVIPAAENMPSGSATRPGDIVRSLSGKTIEILNTDAEGRLILADAITYANRYKPSCIVDFATLTGAVVVALGNFATGLISNNQELADEIIGFGNKAGEKVWQLPLWEEYKELLKTEVADIANISLKPGAGTILGGAFLEKFVEKTPWVHLDIAGTAYGDAGPVYAKGSTGVGVQLIIEWLMHGKYFKNKHLL